MAYNVLRCPASVHVVRITLREATREMGKLRTLKNVDAHGRGSAESPQKAHPRGHWYLTMHRLKVGVDSRMVAVR
jgi:hypothetical protein